MTTKTVLPRFAVLAWNQFSSTRSASQGVCVTLTRITTAAPFGDSSVLSLHLGLRSAWWPASAMPLTAVTSGRKEAQANCEWISRKLKIQGACLLSADSAKLGGARGLVLNGAKAYRIWLYGRIRRTYSHISE